MEKTDMKIPVIMEERKSGVAGRIVGLLAGGVVLLAVAVIVLIACGTYIIQEQNECEETTSPTAVVPRNEKAIENDHVTHRNATDQHRNDQKEHSIVYPESRREFSVSRDSKTGYVTNVIFFDFAKGITAIYLAKEHKCYLFVGIDETLTNEKQSNLTMSYAIGDNVEDSSDLPTEMAPFCSASNTYRMYKPDEHEGDVQKRSSSWKCCCQEFCVKIGEECHYDYHYHYICEDIFHCVFLCDRLPICPWNFDCYYSGYCLDTPPYCRYI